MRRILPAALLVSALSALWAYGTGGGSDAVSEAVDRPNRRAAPPSASTGPDLAAQTAVPSFSIERSAPTTTQQDLFAPKTWQAPPPPPAPSVALAPPVSAPPAPPQPPPLPFRYVGRLQHGDEPEIVFLQMGERAIEGRVGAQLDRDYVLEKVEARALHFRYLPLNQQQSIAIPTE